ncbi:MAG TPA: hypothetical protein VKB60_06615, partial [Terriglobales bacterium]|nr:hypothetical protein [Terriglobales bacterium]
RRHSKPEGETAFDVCRASPKDETAVEPCQNKPVRAKQPLTHLAANSNGEAEVLAGKAKPEGRNGF